MSKGIANNKAANTLLTDWLNFYQQTERNNIIFTKNNGYGKRAQS